MRILVAEDEAIQRRLLERLLTGWGHEVVTATDGREAWALLQGPNRPSLALLDWMMPAMDGLRICRELRKDAAQPYIYVVLLTAKDRKGDLVEAMEAGADDYLVKPFDAQELKVRLNAGNRILDLQEQLISANRSLQFQATHDPLTGIFNRGAIVGILQNELARGLRDRKPVSIILADIDHFKTINDTLGHSAGDTVLRRTAERMQTAVRTYDSVGRYGGEEFLIVLPGCALTMAGDRAEQLRLILGEPSPNLSRQVTASMGVACSVGAANVEELLANADVALYEAKANGRNRVEIATPLNAMSQSAPSQLLTADTSTRS
jgi:diguanylate cyclase (GGDEF)-like protein